MNSIFTCVYSKVLIKPKTVEIHHFRRLGFWSLNVVKRMEIWNLQNHMVNSSLISKNSKLIDFGVKWLILNPIHFRKSCSSKTLGFRKYWWDISTIRNWPVNYSSECCTIQRSENLKSKLWCLNSYKSDSALKWVIKIKTAY